MVLVADAFRRLKTCLKNEVTVIPMKQIIVHTSLFTLALAALVLLCSMFIKGRRTVDSGNATEEDVDKLVNYGILATELSVVLTAISSLPIIFILSRIQERVIKEELEPTETNFSTAESFEADAFFLDIPTKNLLTSNHRQTSIQIENENLNSIKI